MPLDRFCIDCRWHSQADESPLHYCDYSWLDLVTKEPIPFRVTCGDMRRTLCGPEGQLWEARA